MGLILQLSALCTKKKKQFWSKSNRVFFFFFLWVSAMKNNLSSTKKEFFSHWRWRKQNAQAYFAKVVEIVRTSSERAPLCFHFWAWFHVHQLQFRATCIFGNSFIPVTTLSHQWKSGKKVFRCYHVWRATPTYKIGGDHCHVLKRSDRSPQLPNLASGLFWVHPNWRFHLQKLP